MASCSDINNVVFPIHIGINRDLIPLEHHEKRVPYTHRDKPEARRLHGKTQCRVPYTHRDKPWLGIVTVAFMGGGPYTHRDKPRYS